MKFYSYAFFLFKKNNFIYFWLHWVFVAVQGLSLVVVSGGYSPVVVPGPPIVVAALVAELRL